MKLTQKFTIPHDATWLRPDYAYSEYQTLAKGVSPEEIEWNGKYKQVRELRDIAIFGLAMSTLRKTPFFVQMNTQSDSPDAFLMTESNVSTVSIAPVELTVYARSKVGLPTKTLEEKLEEKKGKLNKLPDQYWLMIHIGKDLVVDYHAISSKLHSLKAQFNVFSIQEISSYPATIARFVAYNPRLEILDLNIGKSYYDLSKSNIPQTVFTKKGFPPTK